MKIKAGGTGACGAVRQRLDTQAYGAAVRQKLAAPNRPRGRARAAGRARGAPPGGAGRRYLDCAMASTDSKFAASSLPAFSMCLVIAARAASASPALSALRMAA